MTSQKIQEKVRRQVDDKHCTPESISKWIQKRQWTFSVLLTFVFVLLRGKFWYPDPPQRTMGALLSLFFSLTLVVNEGLFPPLVFLCCWWGVSGSQESEDFLERTFKWSLYLSLASWDSMSLAPPKWGRAPSRDPLLSKEPKEQTCSSAAALSSHRPSNLFFCLPFCFFLPILVLFFILPCRRTCLSVRHFLKNLYIDVPRLYPLFLLVMPKRL